MKTRDQRIEKKVLGGLVQYKQALQFTDKMSPGYFTNGESVALFKLITLYNNKYHELLSIDVFEELLMDHVLKEEERVPIRVVFDDALGANVEEADLGFLVDKLGEYFRIRRIRKLLKDSAVSIEKEPINEVSRKIFTGVQDVMSVIDGLETDRGFVWENAKARWEEYARRAESKEEVLEGVSSGMEMLDASIGGLRPSTVIMFYGPSGVGKSRMLINIAYNVCSPKKGEGRDALYISREMGRDLLERCIDSRSTMLEFGDITHGTLTEKKTKRYRRMLVRQAKAKPPFYIVDISQGGTTASIFSEIERYIHREAKTPAVVCVDYLNLLNPVGSWSTTSERLGLVALELHDIARYFRVCLVTATQENRAGAKSKEKSLEHIYGSHYIIPHVEVAIALKCEMDDEVNGDLLGIPVKNRYGSLKNMDFVVQWARNYVGDPIETKGDNLKEEDKAHGAIRRD